MGREADAVKAAVAAAEDVIFARYNRSDVGDLDVTIQFEDEEVEIDVYVSIPGAADEAEIADEAALAARAVMDQEFEGTS